MSALGFAMSMGSAPRPNVSRRIAETNEPVIVQMKKLSAARPRALSLSQGVVHWAPPAAAMQTAMRSMADDPAVNSYGPAEGSPELREALRRKVNLENGLTDVDVMVTAGANQAFVNVVLALCDEDDEVLLFKPYYFNHLMALQMTGSARKVTFGECDPTTFCPDLVRLEARLADATQATPKMLVLVNPCNPTGVNLTRDVLERVRALCEKQNIWLVLDNTYEHFVYDGGKHVCLSGPGILNIFSFSKAYGMMGWRMGYVCYDARPSAAGVLLGDELAKVQDTIPICPNQLSMKLALAAIQQGRGWVSANVVSLEENRETVRHALSVALGPDAVCASAGAIYLWARLPEGGAQSDEELAKRLVNDYEVVIVPGSAFGCPGYIRAAFGNLNAADCKEAASRLQQGLQEVLG